MASPPTPVAVSVPNCSQGEGSDRHQGSRPEQLRGCTLGPNLEVGGCGKVTPSPLPRACGNASGAAVPVHTTRSGSASRSSACDDPRRDTTHDATPTTNARKRTARCGERDSPSREADAIPFSFQRNTSQKLNADRPTVSTTQPFYDSDGKDKGNTSQNGLGICDGVLGDLVCNDFLTINLLGGRCQR